MKLTPYQKRIVKQALYDALEWKFHLSQTAWRHEASLTVTQMQKAAEARIRKRRAYRKLQRVLEEE